MHPKIYGHLNKSDIKYRYSIPIPLHKLRHIPGSLLCPMNVIEQMTISDQGKIINNQRACHDLSYKFSPSNNSVNSRVDAPQLQDCMFGHWLLRLIHFIITLRLQHPNMPILLQKIDWKSAYRRAQPALGDGNSMLFNLQRLGFNSPPRGVWRLPISKWMGCYIRNDNRHS